MRGPSSVVISISWCSPNLPRPLTCRHHQDSREGDLWADFFFPTKIARKKERGRKPKEDEGRRGLAFYEEVRPSSMFSSSHSGCK